MSIASLNEGSVVTQDPGAGAVTVINAVTPHATLNVHIGILVQIDRTDTTSETMFTFVTTIGSFVRTFKLVSEGSTKFFYENDHFVEAGETVTLTVASNDTDDDDVDFQYYIYDMSQTALETVVDTLKWAEGIVYVNDDTGTNSTVYPYGTVDAPTDTIANAKIIADANNLKSINVHGNHTLAAAMEYYNFFSDWHMDLNHTLNLGGQDVDHSTFTKITLVGVNGGGGGFGDQIRCAYCLVLGLTDFNGVLTKGFMSGVCSIVDGGYFAAIDTFFGYLVNCTLTLQSPGECNIVNMRGAVAFAGMDGGTCDISLEGGALTINNTCTAGTINITGHGTVVDNNGGTTVNDYSVPTATEIIDEWETQSQADPTGFHVNVKEVNGTPQTANDNGADINAIKAKTDNQPAGIPKNVAYSNFEFVMISSTNHINPQQNLTSFTAEISKDGGAFASLTNSVSEVGKGVYKVDLTQAEMNASMITLSFQATGADPRLVTMATSA